MLVGVNHEPSIIDAVLSDPTEFLEAVERGGPGWSDPYGGPEGVARIAGRLRDQAKEQQRRYGAIRATAIAALLQDRSLTSVAKALGVSKSAVHKTHRESIATAHENPYFHLAVEERSW